MTAIPPQNISANPEPDNTSPQAPKRSRRRVWRIAGILSVLAVVLAPVFVAKSSLRQQILPMLLPEYPADITSGRASLMWWSSVELNDVQFYDTEKQPLLHVEKIISEKSLISLLADQIRVGGFQIQKPHLQIRIREAGSNLEDTLAPLLAPSEDSKGLDIAFQIREGVVEVEDITTGRTTELHNVGADARLPLNPTEAITVRGTAEVQKAAADGNAGSLDFDVSYRQSTDENNIPGETGTLRLKTSDLRLNALAAVFGRLGTDVNITGVVVSDLAAEWNRTHSEQPAVGIKLNGALNATNVSLHVPAWLGQDTFQLEYLTHEGQLEYDAGELAIKELALKSDVLTCQANGMLNVPQMLRAWKSPATDFPSEEFHFAGEINLARIARMLPHTLKLREGLELQTGNAELALDADTIDGEQQLIGKINTSRIVALANGQEIVWDKPLELNLKARNTATGPVLDELACRADFLSLWAQGTPDNATFKAACKLDHLMTELNRFANLESYRLAGRIDAGLTVRRLSPDILRGAASAIVKNFSFSKPGNPPAPPWEEPQLVLAAGGDLVSQPDKPRQIQNLSVRVTAGGDELQITQTEPFDWSKDWQNLGLIAELRGELRNWQNRLKPFVSTDGWQMEGNVIATAKAKLSKQRMTLEQAIADFQNLKLQAEGLNIDESRVHVETQAEWSEETQKLQLPVTTWASPSLSLRADEVEYYTTPEGTPRTSGKVVFRGGVAALSRWVKLNQSLGTDQSLTGTASGQIDLTMNNQAADANWNLMIENAALVKVTRRDPPPGLGFRSVATTAQTEPVWSEDRVMFRGGGVYHFAQDHLQFRPTLLESPWLYLTASGHVQQASTVGDANLTGTLTCNMPMLAERFRSSLGNSIQIVGQESRAFTLRGPLWGAAGNQRVANELTAFASLPWQRLSAYGIPVGPAELRADLNLGNLQLGPLDAAIGTGRMKLNAKLPLNAPRLAVQIEKGPLLENIRLTPEVSQDFIKFAVPVLADSTQTEGEFSAFLTSEAIVPLDNPNMMNASGILAIESAQMRPGRLANSLLEVVKQIKSLVRGQAAGGVLPADQSLIQLERQNLNLQAANGRIYHQNLKMILADVPISTSGSVGFDETLALTAEIPINPDWLRQNRFLAGLQGQTLKIPIGGTLSQPQPDTRSVLSALQQAGQNATGRLIEDELQNQFNRLLKRQ